MLAERIISVLPTRLYEADPFHGVLLRGRIEAPRGPPARTRGRLAFHGVLLRGRIEAASAQVEPERAQRALSTEFYSVAALKPYGAI